MTAEHDCSKKWVWAVTGSHRCFRPATVERDGKWWCWQHDPERVKADREKRRAGWQAKMDREDAKYERTARNARLGALVTPELAMLLEDVVSGETANYDRMQREPARALAARIREALEMDSD